MRGPIRIPKAFLLGLPNIEKLTAGTVFIVYLLSCQAWLGAVCWSPFYLPPYKQLSPRISTDPVLFSQLLQIGTLSNRQTLTLIGLEESHPLGRPAL